MTLPTIDPVLLATLYVALAALAAYELLLVLPLRLRVRRLRRHSRTLARELKSLSGLAARFAADRKALHAQMLRLEERIGQLNLRTDARPYEQAIALAEHGAEQASLSRTLGLTQSEAELVSLLHGKQPRSPRRARR
jgi:hypothetical protein